VQPAIDLNMLAEPEDRRRLREAVRLCVALGRDPAFGDVISGRVGLDDDLLGSDDALDAWMLREVTHTNHLCGTCRMGPADDPGAVVDGQGRAHGLEGLRVADCAIMPDCVRANTNATAMMTGERMADLIREQ
jgi:choline dehydrogenase-like flavoprotein